LSKSRPLGSRGLRTRASKRGTLLKAVCFTDIDVSNVKTVADMHRHAVYYNKHWWPAF